MIRPAVNSDAASFATKLFVGQASCSGRKKRTEDRSFGGMGIKDLR